MIYNIKRAFTILSLVIFGGVLVYNCEPEPDSLGEQLFLDGAANGNEVSYDVIAYNINNNDSIRSDAAKLGLATLGAFSEGQFGLQKASYYTQLRLPAYDPDFGANPEVDSVVLVIKPLYVSDSLTATTDEDYVFPDGDVAAKKVVNTYPVVKYGKAKFNEGKLTVQVHEVTDFLGGYNDIAYSDKTYAASTLLGSKTFTGNVNSVAITKDSDNSSLFTSEVGFRIPLDSAFFKTKIIDKKGQIELKDVSNFIRYFRGLKISVTESDGYLFQFSPSNVELVMYYKSDKVDGSTTTTRPQSTYKFSIGNGNVHIGHYQYERTGSALQTAPAPNTSTGDLKLFAQGMGGNSIGIKFKKEEIDKLKELYQKNKAAIISAKIRMYTDPTNWDNKYKKPQTFTLVQKDIVDGKETTNFTADLLSYSGVIANYNYIRAYDLEKNPAYYDISVTKSLKDIVEVGENYENRYFKVDMGTFLTSSGGSTLAGYQYTSRPYATDRAVFVGSDPNNADDPENPSREIKLIVTYGTK